MAAYLYEILYRGKPDGTGDYHVIVAEETTVAGTTTTVLSATMTPQKATDEGFPLPAILATLNTGLQQQNADLTAQVATLTQELETATASPVAAPAEPAVVSNGSN